jgi:NADH-quinone oxidoreductase subunit L
MPPFAGFFSKDEILFSTFTAENAAWGGVPKILWIIGLITAGLTAFYMMRAFALTFLGKPRFDEKHHVHEAPFSMALPLVILGAGSILAGFLGTPEVLGLGPNHFHHWLEPVFAHGAHGAAAHGAAAHGGEVAHASGGLEISLMLVSIGVALAGLGAAWHFYLRRPELAAAWSKRLGGLHRLLTEKYYVDEIYDAVLVRPTGAFARSVLWKFVDVWIIDGIVNLVGILSRVVSYVVRFFQVGSVQAYALVILAGVIILLMGVF